MFGSKLLEGLDLSSYPSSDSTSDMTVEETVAQQLAQVVFDTQREFTSSLPFGVIDGTSPYAPPSLSEILRGDHSGAARPEPGRGPVVLGDAQLLTHSHLITYGGKNEARQGNLRHCQSLPPPSHRDLLLVPLRETPCSSNLEPSLQGRPPVQVICLPFLFPLLTHPHRASGLRLWKDMLRYGSSKPPLEILEEVGGGGLDPSYLMRELE
jgi:hypothetical protein